MLAKLRIGSCFHGLLFFHAGSPIITTFPVDQRIIEGSSTQISCRADANPSPVITWLFNGVTIGNDPKHSVYGNGDLTLMNLEKNQGGSYKCRAQNFLGTEETLAFVVVLGKDFGENSCKTLRGINLFSYTLRYMCVEEQPLV